MISHEKQESKRKGGSVFCWLCALKVVPMTLLAVIASWTVVSWIWSPHIPPRDGDFDIDLQDVAKMLTLFTMTPILSSFLAPVIRCLHRCSRRNGRRRGWITISRGHCSGCEPDWPQVLLVLVKLFAIGAIGIMWLLIYSYTETQLLQMLPDLLYLLINVLFTLPITFSIPVVILIRYCHSCELS